jgi:protein SERAC1
VSEPLLSTVRLSPASVMDVVFVHGITGHHIESWTHTSNDKEKSKFFWPKNLETSGVSANVYSFKYGSSYLAKVGEKEFNIFELGKAMTEVMAIEGLGARETAFIGHSMGGLVIKEALRSSAASSDLEKKRISANTRLVCFIATPHKGGGVARLLSSVAKGLSSPSIDMLSNDSGYLTALNESYRSLAREKAVGTIAYYEKHKTSGVLVVSEQDADPGVDGCEPQAIAADHISIARPASSEAMLYRSVSRHLAKVAEACGSTAQDERNQDPLSPFEYGTASPSERRDLLQKLIDAGREAEYPHANDLQNRFAQRYIKLGLLSESKQLHDQILSEVEQRFIVHVFHAKICKGATDDEIASAIQTNVVDPVAEKFRSGRIGSANVLEAIYYLTQQCYLRWDRPK